MKEDYVRAATRFDRFVQKSPSDPRVLQAMYYSAICRLELDQPKLAAERLRFLLDRVVSMDTLLPSSPDFVPDPASLRLALGMACRRMGDETSALTYFESAWISSSNAYERAAAREQIRTSWLMVPRPASSTPKVAPPEVRPPPMASSQQSSSSGVWVVQVVSTPDQNLASEIFSTLLADSWPVYREMTQMGGAPYIRLRVGPYESQSEAARVRTALRYRHHIDGWVTKK